MAMVECPECSRHISQHAENCPGCGFPLQKHVRELAGNIQESEQGRTKQTIAIISITAIAATLVIGGFALGFFLFTQDEDPATTPGEYSEDITIDASDMDSFFSTTSAIEDQLDREEEDEFNEALSVIYLKHNSDHLVSPNDVELFHERMEAAHGMTTEEVVEKALSILITNVENQLSSLEPHQEYRKNQLNDFLESPQVDASYYQSDRW